MLMRRTRKGLAGWAKRGIFDLMMTHTCPHCGAVYEVTETKEAFCDKDTADCQECGKEMAQWNSPRIPSYHLIKKKSGK
jgi:transcription elongation factor Elf1